jgi:AraC-like DNA-binding protein
MQRFAHTELDWRAFQSVLGRHLAPLRVSSSRDFHGSIRTAMHGDMFLSRLSASSHVARGALRSPREQSLVFVHITRGSAQVIQDGRMAEVGAGDFFLYDPGKAYTLEFCGDYENIGVALPLQRLSGYSRHVTKLTATRIDGGSVMADMTGAVLDRFERGAAEAPVEFGARLVRSAVDAIDTLCWHEVAERGMVAAARPTLLHEAFDYIEANLDAPDLSPETLARAMHLSLRSVYGLFEDADLSVSATIRRRRLERCEQELADPAFARDTVAAIGARWGFASPTNFSRAFRQAFGCTPIEWRTSSAA